MSKKVETRTAKREESDGKRGTERRPRRPKIKDSEAARPGKRREQQREQRSQENTNEKIERERQNSSVEADITRGDQSPSQPIQAWSVRVVSVVVLVVRRMLKGWMPVREGKAAMNEH